MTGGARRFAGAGERSKPKEEGGVRLRVHRTASHERSPLRGRAADPGVLVTGRQMRRATPGSLSRGDEKF